MVVEATMAAIGERTAERQVRQPSSHAIDNDLGVGSFGASLFNCVCF